MDLYSIQDIFTGRAFRIPAYQRGYSWEREQWQDLLDDLSYLPDDRDHFTGMVVVAPTNEYLMDNEGTRHQWVDVVDGQQRLTTIVIFLEALRRCAPENLAEGIRKRYIAARDSVDQPHTKLRLAGPAQTYFERSVLAETAAPGSYATAAERRLRDAMRFFSKYLADARRDSPAEFPTMVFALYEKLTQHLKVMLYEVESDAEVGVMFEVMNNRGRQLSELDLVKNYVLFLGTKLALPDNEASFLESDVADSWSKLLAALMDAGLGSSADEDRLLRSTWLMAYDPSRRHWHRSRSIKDRFNLRDYADRDIALLQELRDYVRLLSDCAGLFSDIYQPTRHGAFTGLTEHPQFLKRIARSSERLLRLNVIGVFLPLLMATRLAQPTNPSLYADMVELCEKFAFRVYRVARLRADAGESSLVSLAHRIFTRELAADDVLDEVATVLSWYCSDQKFEQAFALHDVDNDWYSWGGLRYFLFEYEQHLCGADPPEVHWEVIEKLDREKTIEHILPQTATDPYWRERFDEQELKRWTHDLGNLALSADNSSYSNRPYPSKRERAEMHRPCYLRSPMKNEREIGQLWTDWTPQSVNERRERLVKFALDRWSVAMPDENTAQEPPPDVEEPSSYES